MKRGRFGRTSEIPKFLFPYKFTPVTMKFKGRMFLAFLFMRNGTINRKHFAVTGNHHGHHYSQTGINNHIQSNHLFTK